MRLLVTGATGFVGGHLARQARAGGHEVVAVARAGSDTRALEALGCRVLRTDGTTAALVDGVAAADPDVAVHLAARFVAEHQTAQLDGILEDNLRFGAQLFEGLAASRCRSVVIAGTSWQHGHAPGAQDEPVCLYAAAKTAFEALAAWWVAARSFRVTSLKLFDTYGPDDPRGKLFSALLRAARSGEPLALSPGEQRLDLLYVDDAVAAFLAVAEAPSAGAAFRAYGLPSGERHTLREVVALFEEALGQPIPVRWGARPYREREVMEPWDGAPALPGWSPRVSLREGLARLAHAGR